MFVFFQLKEKLKAAIKRIRISTFYIKKTCEFLSTSKLLGRTRVSLLPEHPPRSHPAPGLLDQPFQHVKQEWLGINLPDCCACCEGEKFYFFLYWSARESSSPSFQYLPAETHICWFLFMISQVLLKITKCSAWAHDPIWSSNIYYSLDTGPSAGPEPPRNFHCFLLEPIPPCSPAALPTHPPPKKRTVTKHIVTCVVFLKIQGDQEEDHRAHRLSPPPKKIC